MTRQMRRKEKQMDSKAAEALLQRGEYGVLCTCGEDGYPYGVPVNYVYEGGSIYFHCAMSAGKKLENICRNEKVSFTVVGDTQVLAEKFSEKYESVIAFGRAYEVPMERKTDALLKLIEKYSPEYKEEGVCYIERAKGKTGVYEIKVEFLTGKSANRQNEKQ